MTSGSSNTSNISRASRSMLSSPARALLNASASGFSPPANSSLLDSSAAQERSVYDSPEEKAVSFNSEVHDDKGDTYQLSLGAIR